MVNLAVDLDERFGGDVAAESRRLLETAGFTVERRPSADDRTLAWIDETFGGAWSGEAYVATNVIVTRNGAPAGFASFAPQGLNFAWLRGEAAKPGTGVFGPVGVDPDLRGTLRLAQGDTLGLVLLRLTLCEMRARGFARALIGAAGEKLVAYYGRVGAAVVERFEPLQFLKTSPRAVILASGSGTNAHAVIDAVQGGLPLDLRAVVTNRRNAGVIERAARARVRCDTVVWDRENESREQYDGRLLDAVHAHAPQLVLLLGWMHLLSAPFVEAFPHVLNVHPAFLPHDPTHDDVGMPDGSVIPAFRGARAVADAFAVESPWVGASFHEVTMETDRGRVLVRKPLRVAEGEPAENVLDRLHPIEHELVVTGVKRWLYSR